MLMPPEGMIHPVWCACLQSRAWDKNLGESVHLGGGPWSQEGAGRKETHVQRGGESLWGSICGQGKVPLQEGGNDSRVVLGRERGGHL